jgi:hypothetical protein
MEKAAELQLQLDGFAELGMYMVAGIRALVPRGCHDGSPP